MKLKRKSTGEVFDVLEYVEPDKKLPRGRYLLDDGQWRNGVHIEEAFEEVEDGARGDTGVDIPSGPDTGGDAGGDTEGRLYTSLLDSGGEAEDSEGEA